MTWLHRRVVDGLLQKVAMTSMPDVMAEQGAKAMDAFAGGFTPDQRKRIQDGLDQLRQLESEGGTASTQGGGSSGNPAADGALIAVTMRDVVGENKKNPMVSFYAAAIGVMFLLFTASGASGSLLDEAESGTLDRVLSTRVTMTTLLAGKLAFCTLLAFSQLVLMFLWAWLVFKLDFLAHIPGFVIMGRVHRLRSGRLRHAAGQPMPHARTVGCAVDAGDLDHVLGWRKHVPTLPDARSNAEGRSAYDQCVGDRRIHQSLLAR